MRKVFHFFILLVTAVFTTLTIPAVSGSQVLINEFLADPARDWDGDGVTNFRDDEWIEIINGGEAAVDLDGLYLADGDGEIVWRYGFTGSLAPGAVRIVFGSDSRVWEEANGYPIYGLSLNNAGDRLSLYRVSGTDTLLVDSYVYEDMAADDDRSVGRDERHLGTWVIFDAYNPCSERCVPAGAGCIPTPGQTNGCITSTRLESWGSIKRIYID
ncbi:MAG: lamin tail domain-containing protein [bacterium]|nr:MAG: lamin tail domain-containing protein [bacterium]